MYYALVHSKLTYRYGILSRGRACTTTIKPLIVLMNRVIRATVYIYKNCSHYDAVLPLYNNLKMLQIPELYELELLKFMFNYNNSVLPSNFDNYFDTVTAKQSNITRMATSAKYFVPCSNTTTGQKSLMYSGTIIWNSLPRSVTKAQTKQTFQKLVKHHMLCSYIKQ